MCLLFGTSISQSGDDPVTRWGVVSIPPLSVGGGTSTTPHVLEFHGPASCSEIPSGLECNCTSCLGVVQSFFFFFFFFIMNGNTEWVQCALSQVCVSKEKEKEGNDKNKINC